MNIQGTQNVGQHQTQDHQCAHVSNVSHGHCAGFQTDIVSGQTAPVVAISSSTGGAGWYRWFNPATGLSFQKPNIKLRCSLVRKNIIIYYNLFILIYYYCVLSMNVLKCCEYQKNESCWDAFPMALQRSPRASASMGELPGEVETVGFGRRNWRFPKGTPKSSMRKNLAGVCGCSCYKPCHIFSLSSRLLRWFLVCLCCSGWV